MQTCMISAHSQYISHSSKYAVIIYALVLDSV